jgi:predicted dehydrogenase
MPKLTRRRFMTDSAVAGAAAVVAATLPNVHVRGAEPSPAAAAAALRWGIIGTGTRGNSTHVTALNALPPGEHELVALCDVAEDRLQAAAKRATASKSPAKHGDYQKLLADPNVNAVAIATPNLLHREMLLAALQAGKHVLCEKPAGASIEESEAIQRAIDAAPKNVVMFGMQYRHNPKQQKIRELMDAGKIGKPLYIVQNCSRGDWNLSSNVWQYADPKLAGGQPRNWRFSYAATGGTLNEFSCHYFDLLHWYAGAATPATVSADGGIAFYKDDRDTWDHATVTMTYGNGVRAVHTLSLFGPTRADFIVMGDEGSIELVGDGFQLVPRRKPGARATSRPGEDVTLDPTAARKERGGADPAVLALFADFAQCVKTGKKPDADAARALSASRTCWLAERAATRRAEVKWDDTAE